MPKLQWPKRIDFSQEGLSHLNKSPLFTALLKNHLLARRYIVAVPEPDLGDDLWFVERHKPTIFRSQIKSSHTAEEHSSYRRYSFKIQLNNISEWTNLSGYVYFFAMIDDRFHGLAEGKIIGDNDCFLQIDSNRLIQSPPPHVYIEGTKSRKNPYYRAEGRGFHVGCISSGELSSWAAKWLEDPGSSNANGLWIKVEDDGGGRFTYRIGKENITRYFGQTSRGLDAAMAYQAGYGRAVTGTC